MASKDMKMENSTCPSPFHEGEKAIQTRLGVREKMETIGQKVIRNFMPKQHQDFFENLSYVFVGHVDGNLDPWASILFKPKGLITVLNDRVLTLNAKPLYGDPLHSIKVGDKLGVLGIDLSNKRRNRINTQVTSLDMSSIELQIEQSFGNCPKYIHTRSLNIGRSSSQEKNISVSRHAHFNRDIRSLIQQADTFFVASYYHDGQQGNDRSSGADVSHRGGDIGFVHIDSNTQLTIPDYQGNNFYNTLGNIEKSGKAGLLFIDFQSGDLLSLSGTARILWHDTRLAEFSGAQRLWGFELNYGLLLKNALGNL